MHFTAAFLLFLSLVAPPASGAEAGSPALAFELADLSGKVVSLTEYRGKVVLLNFWSALCAPCVAEMPSLNALHISLQDKGLQVIAVSIDASDRLVKEFLIKQPVAFPVLMDREREVYFDVFAAPVLPVSYLLDRDGIVRETFNGPREWDSPVIKAKMVKLLAEK